MLVIYRSSLKARVFVLKRLFRPSLMLEGKAKSLPSSGLPKGVEWAPASLANNRLGCKGRPGANVKKTFYGRNLRIFTIS
jgi:hypothetical protein